jgi:DNA-directed RNA polymerase alpha subunit
MNRIQRNERIFIQRERGDTYKEIAVLFGISPERVRQICSREKRRFERRQSVPTLKTLVSKRLQNALQYNLYNQNLLENPEQIAALGSQKILRIRNIGRKSIKELADALLRLGLIREDDRWLILPEYPGPKQ